MNKRTTLLTVVMILIIAVITITMIMTGGPMHRALQGIRTIRTTSARSIPTVLVRNAPPTKGHLWSTLPI